ncbi:hypothetical protein ABLN67_11250, partial [Mycobacterium tuberculosis]
NALWFNRFGVLTVSIYQRNGVFAFIVETLSRFSCAASAGRAIRHAVAWARPGDVVLIAGKGHETGQRGGGRVRPFDDRVELAAALEALERRA